MSIFTYVAIRGIEESSFSASGNDISAATSDDSFNSSSIDLSGGANDEWVLVAGFTDAANNGWFQINGTPTTTKIIQDTGNLVDESVGDDVTIQGYKRGLGQSYDFTISLQQRTFTRKLNRNVAISKNGKRETILHSSLRTWAITAITKDADSNDAQMQEFLQSVEAGESFTFDPDGTTTYSVKLDMNSWTKEPLSQRGNAHRYTFNIIQAV